MAKKKKNTSPAKRQTGTPATGYLDFTSLVAAIRQAHEHCAAQASRAVNISLTIRNWVIGWYIREYEQNGADRARYGTRLLDSLAVALQEGLDRCYTGRYLGLCRQLFDVYPEIRKSVISELAPLVLPWTPPAGETNAIQKSPISEFGLPPSTLIARLSFTHLVELIAIDDPLKRAFYEVECIRGNWSVRQLKRQVATLYFERSGLSKDREKLAAMVKAGAETAEPKLAIRDPYIFEFLGLKAKDAVEGKGLTDQYLGTQDRVGRVVALDALPMEAVRLEADVMTPHYGDYYQKGEAPGDWISPTRFRFWSSVREPCSSLR